MILPDTNVTIAFFDSREPAFSLLENAINKRKLILSVVTVAEFLVKANRKAEFIMHELVIELGIKEITKEIMEQAVLYRKQALQKSKRSHLLDCFIAATAKVHHATLVTLDHRDYPFDDLSVKQPEDVISI